jgi:hypothetical protein
MNDEVVALCDKLSRLAETSTAEDFGRRLETIIILYGYLEKRFEERFPQEYNDWSFRQERKGSVT